MPVHGHGTAGPPWREGLFGTAHGAVPVVYPHVASSACGRCTRVPGTRVPMPGYLGPPDLGYTSSSDLGHDLGPRPRPEAEAERPRPSHKL